MAKKKKRQETPAEVEQRKIYREADELAAAILERGLSSRVRAIYYRGQEDGFDVLSGDMEAEGKSEDKIQGAIHEYAVGKVWMWMIDEKIITPDTMEQVVGLAISKAT